MNGTTPRARLANERLLLDGATGTELERRGIACPPPLWSAAALLTAPEVVLEIHRDYVRAGADIIVANTFRTNPRTLARAGLRAQAAELNRQAVDLARAAAAEAQPHRAVIVAASVAPVEDCYSPDRVPPDDELVAEHEQMVDWLAAAAPDVIWIETMNSVREAKAAASAAAKRGLPFVISFVLQESGALLSGEPLPSALDDADLPRPLAIGVNCIPPRAINEVVPRLRKFADAGKRDPDCGVLAYGHINNPRPTRGWTYSQTVTPADYAKYVRRWLQLGATIVGGCCGTTPEHVRELRLLV